MKKIFFKIYFILYVRVLSPWMYVLGDWESEEDIGSSGMKLEIVVNHYLVAGNFNPGPLQEQQVFLTELSPAQLNIHKILFGR